MSIPLSLKPTSRPVRPVLLAYVLSVQATFGLVLGLATAQTPAPPAAALPDTTVAPSPSPYFSTLTPALSVRAEVTAGGVNLQWLPAGPARLEPLLRSGVTLTRYSAAADAALPTPDYTRRLSLQPESAWEARGDDSGIYEDLDELLDGPPDPDATADEREVAITSILISVDVDFVAAQLAGLGYADQDARPNTDYTYVVADAETGAALATLQVSTDGVTQYPPPLALGARREQGRAAVSWGRRYTKDVYDAYVVERARLDADLVPGAYRAVSLPIFFLEQDGFPDDSQVFSDSTASRDSAYAYRVQGLTPFSHYGAASDTMVVRADPAVLVPAPDITLMIRVVDTLFRLTWALPPGADADAVAGYNVYSSLEPGVGYEAYARDLPADASEIALVDPEDGRYWAVEVVDVNGQTARSVPKFMRALDRRAPAPPTGLTGAIDTAGVVRLTWEANPEADLLGYRVFASNRDSGYFAQITPDATVATAYVDTVSMALLNERVYYRLTAEDYAGNVSGYSATARLDKPDLRPPVAPVIADVRASERAVVLDVARSPSRDVETQVVQRRASGAPDTTFRLLARLPPATAAVTAKRVLVEDTTAVPGLRYDYRVLAVDDAGLRAASLTVAAGRTPSKVAAAVRGFGAELLPGTPRPTLSWRYGRPRAGTLEGFQLYRTRLVAGAGAEPLPYRLLTPSARGLRLRGGTFYFVDDEAHPGATYAYRLEALLVDGSASPLTEVATVAVPE